MIQQEWMVVAAVLGGIDAVTNHRLVVIYFADVVEFLVRLQEGSWKQLHQFEVKMIVHLEVDYQRVHLRVGVKIYHRVSELPSNQKDELCCYYQLDQCLVLWK